MAQFWKEFEKFLGNKLPCDVKKVLIENEFNNSISLTMLNNDFIQMMEKSVFKDYRFLPGHRALICSLAHKAKEYESFKNTNRTADLLESVMIPVIFKDMMKTALNNLNLEPKQRRYSESIKNFGIYLFIMCGRNAYEVISSNLPLPQSSTVGMRQKFQSHII